MSEHELFTELRAERKRLRQAKLALKDARSARKEVEDRIEQILAQIDSGKTGKPILDAIAAKNGQPESADPPAAEQPRKTRKPRKEHADRREVVISPSGPNRQVPADPERVRKEVQDVVIGPDVNPHYVDHADRFVPAIGPYNQDDALLRACALVAAELDPLRDGGTDDAIFRALIQWPSPRDSGAGRGNPWATIGGSAPRFYYDTDAFYYTDAMDNLGTLKAVKSATLEGAELVKAVRRVYHIRKPKATKADQQPVRTAGVKS